MTKIAFKNATHCDFSWTYLQFKRRTSTCLYCSIGELQQDWFLVKSFPTSTYSQNSVSMEPRRSLAKFWSHTSDHTSDHNTERLVEGAPMSSVSSISGVPSFRFVFSDSFVKCLQDPTEIWNFKRTHPIKVTRSRHVDMFDSSRSRLDFFWSGFCPELVCWIGF